MECSKCSKVFENKFVQCFDEQEIRMYMKRSGVVHLVHGDVVESTNFNYCPYCGEKLNNKNVKTIEPSETLDKIKEFINRNVEYNKPPMNRFEKIAMDECVRQVNIYKNEILKIIKEGESNGKRRFNSSDIQS